MKFVQPAMFAIVCFGVFNFAASAQSATWNGGTGQWNKTPTNWTCSYGPCGPPNGSAWSALIGSGNVNSGTPVNSGLIAVSGAGTLTMNDTSLSVNQLNVGAGGGQGIVNIMNGATVGNDGNLSSQIQIGAGAGTTGTMTVSGSSVVMNAVGIGTGGTGTMSLDNSTLTTGFLTIGSRGKLAVGANTTVEAETGFTLQGGELSFMLDSASEYGTFSSNHGTFDGTIDFDFSDGFAPTAGESFALITASGGGDFSGASYQVDGLESGFQYSIQDEPYGLTLVALDNGISTTITSAAPEPGGFWLMLAAGVTLFVVKVQRHKQA